MRPISSTPMRTIGAVAVAAILSIGSAAAKDQWLHVKVVDAGGEKHETVKINLPLSLVESVLDAVKTDELNEGKIKIGHNDVDCAQLKQFWDAVRNTEDGEYVSVDSGSDHVRVAKSGEYLLVKTDGGKGKNERIDVKIPVQVVDALFSGNAGELNLKAAIKALRGRGDSELIKIDDDDTTVRVWIDGTNGTK